MPTYDYRCGGCDHEFEEFQSITARLLRKCPECGKAKLQRLIGTGAGIIFKGSGFYETDYRSDGYKKAVKAEKEASSGGSGDKSDKPDGKSGKSDGSSASGADSKKASKTDSGSSGKSSGSSSKSGGE